MKANRKFQTMFILVVTVASSIFLLALNLNSTNFNFVEQKQMISAGEKVPLSGLYLSEPGRSNIENALYDYEVSERRPEKFKVEIGHLENGKFKKFKNSDIVSGKFDLIITAKSKKNNKIKFIELYIGGQFRASSTYGKVELEYLWDTTEEDNYQYISIEAFAWDDDNNDKSKKVEVYVKNDNTVVDNEAPVIEYLTAFPNDPNNNQIVRGRVTVQAKARDNEVLSELKLFIRKSGTSNWIRLAHSLSQSSVKTLSYSWNTKALAINNQPKYPNAWYQLKAEAMDKASNTAYKTYWVKVDNSVIDNVAPSITIKVSPIYSSKYVKGTVQVTVEATDNNMISKIELYVDTAFLKRNFNSEKLVCDWDTTQYGNMEWTLRAEVTDDAGNTAIKTFIVKVDNKIPYVMIENPINNKPVSGIVLVRIKLNDDSPYPRLILRIGGVVRWNFETNDKVRDLHWDTRQPINGENINGKTIEIRMDVRDKVGHWNSHRIWVKVNN